LLVNKGVLYSLLSISLTILGEKWIIAKERFMGKAKEIKKEERKKAQKTLKEKRMAKQEKKKNK
jgi:hypothetical protein